MEAQIWPCHKKGQMSTYNNHLNKLSRARSSLLYTKIQPLSFPGSWEEDFEVFLLHMGMTAILFNDPEQFEQIVNTFRLKAPNEIGWKLLKQFQRRRHLKITSFYTCK